MKKLTIILMLIGSWSLQAKIVEIHAFDSNITPVYTPAGVYYIENLASPQFVDTLVWIRIYGPLPAFSLIKEFGVRPPYEGYKAITAVYMPYYNVYAKNEIAFQVIYYNELPVPEFRYMNRIYDKDGDVIFEDYCKYNQVISDKMVCSNGKIYQLPGTLDVEYELTCDCDCDTTIIVTDPSSSIKAVTMSGDYIHPNPTDGYVYFSEPITGKMIIYTLNGSVIDSIDNFTGSSLYMGGYGSGSYIINIANKAYQVVVN